MKNELTQKEIFHSKFFFQIINNFYGFTKDIKKDEIDYAIEGHIIAAHADQEYGIALNESSNFLESHLLNNTDFIYEFDGRYIGLYEYEGGLAVVSIFQGYEIEILGSSIVNFFHDLMVDESADELSLILSNKFNIKFEHYEDDIRYAIDDKIRSYMLFDNVDYCNKYPQLFGYFKSGLNCSLHEAIVDNQQTFSNNIITIWGFCSKTDETYFIGDFVSSSGWIDKGYGRLGTLFYPLKYFTEIQMKQIKKLMGKRLQKYDKHSGHYEGFDFTITISYEIDSNKVVTIKNTTIEKFKEN